MPINLVKMFQWLSGTDVLADLWVDGPEVPNCVNGIYKKHKIGLMSNNNLECKANGTFALWQ